MIILGRIVAPFGVRGWLKIHPFADDPSAWCDLSKWWLSSSDDVADRSTWTEYKLLGVKDQGKGFVAQLEGVDDRTAAEAIDGMYVAVPRSWMPATDPDEYYWDDLVGLSVVNTQGESLGLVSSIIEAAANDVLVVTEGDGEHKSERLLPFVGSVVLDVDVASRTIRVAWERDW